MVMNETEMELFDVKFDDACSAFPHTERLHSHTTKQHKHALWRSPSRPLTMVKALVVVEETSFLSTEFSTYAAESMAKYREAMRVSWEDEGEPFFPQCKPPSQVQKSAHLEGGLGCLPSIRPRRDRGCIQRVRGGGRGMDPGPC